MIRAVVFDMDGLMFDTEKLTVQALNYAGEKLGVGNIGHMVYKTLGMNIETCMRSFFEEYGDKITRVELIRYVKEFFCDYFSKHEVPIKKGLHELLSYLKNNNYKIAVATSANKETVLDHFKSANVMEYFDIIVCGDMIKNSKPAPDIYLKASELLAIKPSECLALEDSPSGILSAFSAGLKPVMIPDLIEPSDEIINLIHFKLSSLNEVIKLLESKCI